VTGAPERCLLGKALALPVNIGLGLKGGPGTDTLAYQENS
jgi:hypothetical protein